MSIARAVWQPDPRRYDSYALEVLARRLLPSAGLFAGKRLRFGHDPAEDAEGAARVLLAALVETGASSLDDLLARTGRRLRALESERCETSQGCVVRRVEPPLTPTSLVFDREAQRAALLEIRREWRAEESILDARRYPRASDPLPPPYHPPYRRRFR